MKTESETWRLSEISVTLRVPLEDADFLKSIEQDYNKQSDAAAEVAVRSIVNAENSYHESHGTYACKLSDMSSQAKSGGTQTFVPGGLSGEIATGKQGGYVFVISGCDGTQYKVVGEPDMPDSGERAFCADESGALRASSDGKATTCLRSGDAVQQRK